MQKEVHGQDRHERGEKSGRERKEHPGDNSHNSAEKNESDDSAFDELLDVPALGNIIIFRGFQISSVDRIIGEFHNIAVGGTGGSESLSHRMFHESFKSGHRTIEMPLRRAGTEDDSIDGPFVSEVKESGEDDEKEEHHDGFFLVFSPNGSEGKYDKCRTSDDDADKRTAGIGEENKSEENDRPDSEKKMVRFLGSEIMKEESRIDKQEIRCGVRPVKYSLKPLDSGSVDAVVDRRGSAEIPITEISGKSEMDENAFTEQKSHKNSRTYGKT